VHPTNGTFCNPTGQVILDTATATATNTTTKTIKSLHLKSKSAEQ
jgi:hypothetical protein